MLATNECAYRECRRLPETRVYRTDRPDLTGRQCCEGHAAKLVRTGRYTDERPDPTCCPQCEGDADVVGRQGRTRTYRCLECGYEYRVTQRRIL